MRITFAPSASRHRISQRRAAYVIEHCPMPLQMTDTSEHGEVVMFLGVDEHGIPLEVGAVQRGDDALVVIHAMRLRPRLRPDFEWVMRWLER